MSNSGGSFFSIPTIVFLIVMYNIFFDDDDEKKPVEVKINKSPIVSQDVKDKFNDVKETFKEVIDQAKEEFYGSKEPVKELINQAKEEVITSKEKKEEPKFNSLDQPPKPEEEMKPLCKEIYVSRIRISRNDYLRRTCIY